MDEFDLLSIIHSKINQQKRYLGKASVEKKVKRNVMQPVEGLFFFVNIKFLYNFSTKSTITTKLRGNED